MPQVANTSGAPGSSRVAAVQGRDGSLLRSFAFSTSALLGIGFLAWVLVGAEAREPSWSSFGESVPRSFLFMLLVMLPSILLALFASSGGWRLAWWQITPTVSFPGIDRASRVVWSMPSSDRPLQNDAQVFSNFPPSLRLGQPYRGEHVPDVSGIDRRDQFVPQARHGVSV